MLSECTYYKHGFLESADIKAMKRPTVATWYECIMDVRGLSKRIHILDLTHNTAHESNMLKVTHQAVRVHCCSQSTRRAERMA